MNSVSSAFRSRVASAKCFVRHHRAKIRAPDANIDYVPDALPAVALPCTAADAIRKPCHLVEHGVNLGDKIYAIGENLCIFWRAQGDVQHGALFGEVDLVARKHGINVVAQTGLLRKVKKQADSLTGNTVLREVEVETQGLQRESFVTLWILGEELPKM